MEMTESEIDDFSPSATLVSFNPPIPLLRGPLPAGLSDDPSIGPFVLAFRDVSSWKSAYQASESKIIAQCEAGSRIGCSISASNKCKSPWWKTMFGGAGMDVSEREQCEEREMSACLALSKGSCVKFAKDKCLAPFSDARISLFNQRKVAKLISQASSKLALGSESHQLALCDLEATSYRGSSLLCRGNSPGESSSKVV